MHGNEPASEWVRRWTHLVRPGGRILDVACGAGRHLRWFAQRGHPVTGVDRSAQALADAAVDGELVEADIENGPWPWPGRQFDAVVVTNYLWRPLLPTVVNSVAPGGVLIYETFAHGNASVGKPSRPDFLLQPGELLTICQPTLRILAYEDGFLQQPERFVQRIVAVREWPCPPEAPARHFLAPAADPASLTAG